MRTKDKLLRIYLNDHLALMTSSLEVAKRAQSRNHGTALGDFLAELSTDIAANKAELLNLMDNVGAPPSRIKQNAAWATEKLGRLKLNGNVRGYSDLSRLIELEGLSALVGAGQRLWQTLRHASSTDFRLAAADYDALLERGSRQLRELDQYHLQAGRRALGDDPMAPVPDRRSAGIDV